ncbi:allantoinase [Bacillaceae bacterium CLA-AA-H227]|uniref:Allantoinase n=1 Tax=Robertmurraya yapensis (ex Hitch et al 2024) TaxID=3133160 RepID=A0ACC6S9P3_9BACI
MPEYDLIIRNGFVVLPSEVMQVDIGIKDGVITKIEEKLTGTANEERDETGNYLFPGMIDVHVHFNDPGRDTWEGFETGSEMMAAGGCTTFFDMPLNGIPSTIDKEALFQKVKTGKGKSIVDFALWGGLVPGNEANLEELSEAGVIGFKAFLSESGNEEFERVDDMTLLRGMKKIASLNKILALHSESDAITKWLVAEKREKGFFTADDYLETRPILAEVEAVERVLSYSKLTGCAIHFVHISSAAAVEKIEEAKKQGLDVTVETCPHYLLFNHDALFEKGALAKCAPPLREKSEQEKLVQLLVEGKFDIVASDHSPSPYSMKDPNIHHLFDAWGGISGGQFTLLSMIELAKKHEISFSKVAQMTATNPAERFSLASKGKIGIGYDADLAIVSLDENFTATEDNFFAKHKQSLYLGHTFPCKVKTTICRGKVVYEDDKTMKQNGKWLKASQEQQIRI